MTRAERIEIVKPLDVDWSTASTILHTQRKVIGQLKQAAVDCIVACELVGADVVKPVIAPDARAAKASGLAYQAILRELDRIRAHKSWNEGQRAALNFSGATLAFVSKHAWADYSAWRSAQYKSPKAGHGKKGRASYGRPQPIEIPKANWSVSKDAKGYFVTAKLLSVGKLRFALHPRGGRQTLPGLLDGSFKRHDLKLIHGERRGKWYALLTYTPPERVTPELDQERVLVVHRGLRNMFTAVSSSDARVRHLPGRKFQAQRASLRARSRELRRVSIFERGTGSRGHGSERHNAALVGLEDKMARVTKTHCQQAAAWAVATAIERGCGTILLESYGGIDNTPELNRSVRALDHGPLYQLKTSLESAAEGAGVRVVEVDYEAINTTCPACLFAHESSHHKSRHMFHCVACQYDRDIDTVAALNMLRTSGFAWGFWEKQLVSYRKEKKAA